MSKFKNFIVNADDLGMGKEQTAGILLAAQKNLIDSASLCVTKIEDDGAIQKALSSLETISIGLHVSLTEGEPCGPTSDIRNILNSRECFLTAQEILEQESSLQGQSLRTEMTAQIDRFINLVGRRPDHLDCHQYFAYLSPTAFTTFLTVASEFEIPVRSPSPFVDEVRLRKFSDRVFNRYEIKLPFDPDIRAGELAAIFKRIPVKSRTDDVVIDFDFQSESALFAQGLLNSKMMELVCHPRVSISDGLEIFSLG